MDYKENLAAGNEPDEGGVSEGHRRSARKNAAQRDTALRICVVLLALLAAPRVVLESNRLLFGRTRWDATDLRNFHGQVLVWHSGEDVYEKLDRADYPPASYPVMYAIYAWDNDINRLVWFAHGIITLGFLIWVCVRESGADSKPEKLCVALLPLAMFATGVAFGNGQLTIHALASVAAAVLLLDQSRGRWQRELAAGACMLFALVKPNLTAPFFWIFLLVPRRKAAAAFVILGYLVLTLIGASFQPSSLADQFRGFVSRGTAIAELAGYGDVPLWLNKAGYANLIMPFTVAALGAMGIWVWAERKADRWLLLGGLALMTRFWAYHRLYDDMLNLFAFVALMRLAKGLAGNDESDPVAWSVLLIALTTIPGPATPLEYWRGWVSIALRSWQTAVRFLMLAVIVHRAWTYRDQARRRVAPAFSAGA